MREKVEKKTISAYKEETVSTTTHLCSFMNNANMLPEVAIFLPTDRAGRAELVVDVVDVALQVGLQVAAVPTLGALKVFHL